jgi:hypothetical protein
MEPLILRDKTHFWPLCCGNLKVTKIEPHQHTLQHKTRAVRPKSLYRRNISARPACALIRMIGIHPHSAHPVRIDVKNITGVV